MFPVQDPVLLTARGLVSSVLLGPQFRESLINGYRHVLVTVKFASLSPDWLHFLVLFIESGPGSDQ